MWRAPGHFDISFGQINLQVMFPEPGMSEYQFLFTQAGDTEGGPFQVVFVPENETYSLSYGTGFIRRSIYVVDQNWASQFLQIEPATFGIISVDEISSRSTVHQRIVGFPFCGDALHKA